MARLLCQLAMLVATVSSGCVAAGRGELAVSSGKLSYTSETELTLTLPPTAILPEPSP